MKIYAANGDGEIVSKEADKGFYGEDVYNDRVWSPDKPKATAGKVPVLKDKSWTYSDDVRGAYYNKEDGREIIVSALTAEKAKAEQGIDIAEHVKDKPSASLKFPYYDKGWKEDTAKVMAFADAEKVARNQAKIWAKIQADAIAALGSELE